MNLALWWPVKFHCSSVCPKKPKRGIVCRQTYVFFDGSQNGSNIHYSACFDNHLFRLLFNTFCALVDVLISCSYLGVVPDKTLTKEVKHILRKMACGFKTIYSIRKSSPALECSRYQPLTLSSKTFEWYIRKPIDPIGKTTELDD